MSFPLQSHYNVDSGVVIKLTWKLVMGRSDGFHWIISPMPSFFLMTGCLTTRDWTREMKLLVHQYTCAVQYSTVQYSTVQYSTVQDTANNNPHLQRRGEAEHHWDGDQRHQVQSLK